MKIHELKSHLMQFNGVVTRRKTHEFRNNDRDFQVGDWLILHEYDPDEQGNPEGKPFTGSMALVEVRHITRGPDFDIPEGYCVMSIHLVHDHEEEDE